jgi:hypothetical protein
MRTKQQGGLDHGWMTPSQFCATVAIGSVCVVFSQASSSTSPFDLANQRVYQSRLSLGGNKRGARGKSPVPIRGNGASVMSCIKVGSVGRSCRTSTGLAGYDIGSKLGRIDCRAWINLKGGNINFWCTPYLRGIPSARMLILEDWVRVKGCFPIGEKTAINHGQSPTRPTTRPCALQIMAGIVPIPSLTCALRSFWRGSCCNTPQDGG